jgi:hypothetical protein
MQLSDFFLVFLYGLANRNAFILHTPVHVINNNW